MVARGLGFLGACVHPAHVNAEAFPAGAPVRPGSLASGIPPLLLGLSAGRVRRAALQVLALGDGEELRPGVLAFRPGLAGMLQCMPGAGRGVPSARALGLFAARVLFEPVAS